MPSPGWAYTNMAALRRPWHRPFYQKGSRRQIEESWTTKAKNNSNHLPCKRNLARWPRRDWWRRKENSVTHHKRLLWASTMTSSSKASPPISNSLPVPPSTNVVVPSSKYASTSSSTWQKLPSAKQASAYSLAHHYSNLQTTQQISNSTTAL